jgi:TadE-like protein
VLSRLRGKRGQSLVETAMVLPVLVLLMLGMVDYGRAYYFQVAVTNAAREGTRTGIVNIYLGPRVPTCVSPYSYCPVQTDSNIRQAVHNELAGTGIVVADSDILICPPYSASDPSCPTTETRVGDYAANVKNYDLSVKVSYPFSLYTPMFKSLLGDPLWVRPDVSMRTDY